MTLRWLKFNAVGALGIVAQLAVLGVLHGWFHLNYLVATALAVEAAILQNFCWHRSWTWPDRVSGGAWPALLRFNLGAGAVSLLTNLVFMRWLVGAHRVPYLLANLAAIAAGSVGNFLVSDRLVFRKRAQSVTLETEDLPCARR